MVRLVAEEVGNAHVCHRLPGNRRLPVLQCSAAEAIVGEHRAPRPYSVSRHSAATTSLAKSERDANVSDMALLWPAEPRNYYR